VFGWALAERIRETVTRWSALGLLAPTDTFTFLELGGGDGCLACDVLDYVSARATDSEWDQIATRFEYVIGELSPSLRQLQEQILEEHIGAGRARVVECDARQLSWQGPFKGLVFCNELIDAFPVEKLRVRGQAEAISRVHVDRDALDSEASVVAETLVPLSEGWQDDNGIAADLPTELAEYLRGLQPLIADLEACGLLPVDVYWPPSLPTFVESLAKLLSTEGNVGAALLVDYGGTSRHVLDPRSVAPHMRSYGPDRKLAHTSDVYSDSGFRDITCDVDFTELARLARHHSLEVGFFGHQVAIDPGTLVISETEKVDAILSRLTRENGYAPGVARLAASHVLKRFRRAPCFWMMWLSAAHVPSPNMNCAAALQPGGNALFTLASSVDREQLECELMRAGQPPELACRLKPCGDIAADMSDAGVLERYHAVMGLLESCDWLRSPGTVCT